MATRPMDAEVTEHGRALYREGHIVQDIAEKLGISIGCLYGHLTDADKRARANAKLARREARPLADKPAGLPKIAKNVKALPPAVHEDNPQTGMPEPVNQAYEPYSIDRPGVWGIISDIHLPYHDRTTVELFVRECKRRGAIGVLLNGDTLDSHEISDHDKDPSAPRYVKEIELGQQMLSWLRGQLPDADLVLKTGNHEDRLERYIIRRAPALFGIQGLTLQSLLNLGEYGIECVTDKRVIQLGKLNVLHGHEYKGGVQSPVNPARGLYLKARSVAICGHHHQSSEHHAKDIRGHAEAAWSTGCACFLSPAYMPLNNWNSGFAFVEVDEDGGFMVENKRVLKGRIV